MEFAASPTPMESSCGQDSLWSLLELEEAGQRLRRSPPRRSHHHRRHHSAVKAHSSEEAPELPTRVTLARASSATVLSPVAPASPGCPSSPWEFSPLRRSPSPSPSPSLLYHCLASLQRQDGGDIYSIAVARGAVFTGSESDSVRVWRQPDCAAEWGHIRTGHGRVRCLLAHGGALFTVHRDDRVRVWTFSGAAASTSNDSLQSKKVATLPPRSVAAALFPFRKIRSPTQHRDAISCLALNHADGLLYTASWDRKVKAWRLAEKTCVDSFVAHEGQVTAILVNQLDGGVFTASADGAVKLWRRVYGDTAEHALTVVLRFQASPVNALALSHARETGGCFLYSGSSDGYVNIWESEAAASSGRYNHGGFLQGHRKAVLSLVAVGRMLVSGSEDATIRIWRREEGSGGLHTCLAVMEGHRGPVRCMAASVEVGRDGSGLLLYSAGMDRVVKVWRIRVVGKGEEEEEVVAVAPAGKMVGAVADQGECRSGGGKEYEMSPVLSPRWVEKKLLRSQFY